MPFVVSADLNHAHEQAMNFWKKLTQGQERRLWVTMENQLDQSLKTYGNDTLSSKCEIVEGSGFSLDETLPAGKYGLCSWHGSIRITGVVALYLETHPVGGEFFDEIVRPYAREVVIFKAYSLISRAGKNVVHAEATVRNGAISDGRLLTFDYSKPNGGYDTTQLQVANTPFGNFTSQPAAVAWDGRRYEVTNSITGRHFCDAKVIVRYAQ